MPHILIVYASHDGQTEKICRTLQGVIQETGQQTTLLPIDQAAQVDPAGFDKIVIGAGIRYGKHSPEIAAFITQNQAILDSKPNAFFSVNLVARKPEKSRPASNPYLQKFLKRINWKPKNLAVFAGKLDYPSYGCFDRFMIRLIMWMTHGPTDPMAVVEFTDWRQVKAFGQQIATM